MTTRTSSKTVGSATTSAPILIDHNANNFAVGFGVVLSANATLTYKVQHTFDDVMDSSVTATWFDHPDVTAIVDVNADGNYAFPVRAVRLNVTAYTDGNATLTVMQVA